MSEDAAVREWERLAYAIAGRFRFPGADEDDVRQEALVGLLVGLRAHDATKGPLKPFLGMVVDRWLQARLNYYLAQKHVVLNDALRAGVDDDGALIPILDVLPVRTPGPETTTIDRERLAAVVDAVRRLTPLEREAVAYAVNGTPYMVGGRVNKAVDNALQRARRKLERAA